MMSPACRSGSWAASTNRSRSCSIPVCSFAEIYTWDQLFGSEPRSVSSLRRSHLLCATITCWWLRWGVICSRKCSKLAEGQERSSIKITIWALSNALKLRTMPSDSILSVVSRIPAVSMKRKRWPERLTVSSITSRVVPWISLTMAFSSPKSVLSRVDFPAFVSPMIATGVPFLMALPKLNERTKAVIFASICSAKAISSLRSANSNSSWSLKSSSSSMSEVMWRSWSRNWANSRLNPPLIWLSANRCCPAEVAAIKSATASAWLKSILPFIKALLVNSPGSASWHPASIKACSSCCWMKSEPWQLNSTVSSPVKECGARKRAATTSSIKVPCLSKACP